MRWNSWVRQIHRWLSIAFTAAVIINIIALGHDEPATWVYLLALIPLVLLASVRAALAAKWRTARRLGGEM